MNLVADLDERFWLVVPDRFPTPTDATAQAWIERVLAQMAESWGEDWSDDFAQTVPLALQRALEAVEDDDSLTLIFWPDHTIANVVVHLQVGLRAAGEGFLPLDSHARNGAAIDVHRTAALGEGVAVRYYRRDDEAGLTFGGVYYLFQSPTGNVMLWSDATVPALLAPLQGQMEQVLDSLSLDLGPDGPWVPAVLDPAELDAIGGEQWPALVPEPG